MKYILGLLLALNLLSAEAEVSSEPLPTTVTGNCDLKKFSADDVVKMIYNNVVNTSHESLDEMAKHVSPNILFKDAVSVTRGWPQYRKVYEQFITADKLYYKVMDWACSGRNVYMNWVFGMQNEHTNNLYVEFEGVSKFVIDENDQLIINLDNWNEVPPGYSQALRQGNSGGIHYQH